jgi:hypothetical protein
MQARGGNTWPSVPGAPTSPVATAGNQSASVAFVAPADTGFPANAITGYRVTSTPGGFTGTGLTSPVTVTGLTNGTAYTFTVAAQNVNGYGPESIASNSVTPVNPNYIEQVFNTYLWTGNDATQTITNNVNLSANGGLVWIKARTATYSHILSDTIRGTGKFLSSNTTDAQGTDAQDVTAFNTTGFTIGNNARINNPSFTYVGWTFREQAKFFDVVTYTGNGTTQAIAHNLGSTPGFVMVKGTSLSSDWRCFHRSTPTGYFYLNATDALETTSAANNFGNNSTVVAPTSTTLTVGSGGALNGSGQTYIAYLFAHDAGGFGLTGSDNVITCGSFTTDGSGAASVTLGYEPQWVMQKRTDSSTGGNWYVADNMRGMGVNGSRGLFPNLTDIEETTDQGPARINATGFTASRFANATYIYVAIRRGPMAAPTTGTSVFSPQAVNVSAGTKITTGFPVDWQIDYYRGIAANYNSINFSRLTGVSSNSTNSGQCLWTAKTDAEATFAGTLAWDNTGYQQTGNLWPNINNIYWNFARAPSFFDEVCDTGTGSTHTITHNLGVVPELMIRKSRSQSSTSWYCYVASEGASRRGFLNYDFAWGGPDNSIWGGTTPTSTVFTVGADSNVNNNASTYVTYLFATCAGVSKVGSYTGTGATQTIACGFAAGARFVLIKRTDSTGDWYVWDTVRGMVSGTDPSLLLNTTGAEVNANSVYTITTGFQIVSTAAGINASGGTYIFLAIA